MSILDFTIGLFRDPANLRSFVNDPDQALDEAGLADATPQHVHDHAPDEGGLDLDISGVVWGEAVEKSRDA